jgi:ATP-dependent RNA helicase DDX54/DBP10
MVKGVSFESLGLEPWLYRGIKNKGYSLPTPIQRKAIPAALSGTDMIAVAKTGSGKTAAFLVPLLHRLKEHSSTVGARAVVISPTRELAIQTLRFATELGKYSNLKFALLVGGDGLKQEFTKLSENPDVIIATPGRLMHFIIELKYSLSKVEISVLDEADRLVEMGLMEQVKVILSSMSLGSRQTLCFSATLPDTLAEFSKTGLSQPLLVKLDQEFRLPETLDLDFFVVRSEDKLAALVHVLKGFGRQSGIVFVATRHHVEYLEMYLGLIGFLAIGLFGAMDEEARRKALKIFTKKKKNLLITTDVTARGIDIPFLEFVVHFDFPATPKLFIHRSGRAARAGRYGKCVALVSSPDIPYLIDTFLQIGGHDERRLGSIPEDLLTSEKEEINQSLQNQDLSDLERREKSVKNAIKKYNKTRPSASSESVRRSKDFKYSLHPSFDSKPEIVEDFTKKLKDFRPTYNILELNAKFAGKHEIAEQMKEKRMKLKKEKPSSSFIEDPEEVREMEEITKNINLSSNVDGKVKRGQMGSYRAEGFLNYDGIKSFEKGHEISQLSLEMPMDDELGLRKRDKMVWDNKKKKYIQMQKKKEKFEVNQKSQKLYKEWKKETKKRIQNVGENEDPDIVKKVERRNKDRFAKDPRENFNKMKKDKFKERMMHKKTKKFDLKKKLENKIQKKSAFGKSKMIIRN